LRDRTQFLVCLQRQGDRSEASGTGTRRAVRTRGSVRKGGNRLRITAQLIDASTGNHIWADRHDGDLTDIFALQDEITRKVVAAIEPRLIEAEGVRSQARSAEHLGAWEMVVSANSLFWRLTKTEGGVAIDILKRAVERYPSYAPAHSM